EFRPDERHRHARLMGWRTEDRFPEVRDGLEWLTEMLRRVRDGIPPVTEAEFAELEAWFRANEPRLYEVQQGLPSEMLNLDGGRRTCCWYVRYDLKDGARAEGSGQAAEDIRQLRARYPDVG